MICKNIFLVIFLDELELIFLYTVKRFQVLLYNCHNLTSVICLHTNDLELICLHISSTIVFTQLNGFNYCSERFIIIFNINYLHTVKWFQVLL